MNNHGSSEFHPNDEINLYEVYRKLKKGLIFLFNKVLALIKFLFKNLLYFLLLIIIGAAIGYGIHKLRRPYYGYSMTVLLSEFRNDFAQGLVENLSLMANEKNHQELANHLRLSVEDAEKVKSVQFRNLDQDKITEDSVLAGSPFSVEVELYNNSIQDTIEAGILHYLESNHYFATRKQVKKEHLESLVAKLKKDIASIDSTKEASLAVRGPVNGFVYGAPLDPVELYKQSVVMYERQTHLEANLKRLNNFDLVTGFAPKAGPSGPNQDKYMAIGAITSFLLGLFFALYREKRTAKKAITSNSRF